MQIRKTLLYMIILLSTTFVFFQSAAIISIDYLLVMMLILCICLLITQKIIVIDRSVVLYAIILALMVTSLVHTVSVSLTMTYLSTMIYGLVLWIALLNENQTADILKKMLVAFSFVNVFITLLFFFFSSFKTLIAKILPKLNMNFVYESGVLGQTGTNSYVICLAIIYMTTRYLLSNKKRISSIIFLALGILALLLTGKRGPVIWVSVAIAVIDLLQYKTMSKKNIVKRIVAYIITITCIVVFVTIVSNVELVGNSLDRFNVSDNDFSSGRFALYQKAIEIIKSNMLLGIGAGAYNFFGMGAHNDYLQIFAENGILCTCLYFAFIIGNLVKSIKGYFMFRKETLLYFIGVQVFFIFNALTGTSFLHYGFYIIYIMVCVSSISLIRREEKIMELDIDTKC